MFKKFKLIPVMALVAAVALPTVSFASGPSSGPCLLREHRITSVAPYRVDERVGKSSLRRLRGAEVFVQAEPGLTAEWLQLTLARHVAEMRGPRSMPDCVFDVNEVTARVDPAGTGFLVRIIARDTERAEEVLRRARLLLS